MNTKTISGLLLILTLVLSISCKSTLEVSSDYDRSANFSEYQTLSFYNLAATPNVNHLNVERIVNAIRTEMIKKGFRETNYKPDLMVNAVSMLENKQSFSASTNVYGYGGTFRPYGYWNRSGIASGYTTVQPYDYKDGSLLIDVVDTKTKRLVWQGTVTAVIEKQPKNPAEAIDQAGAVCRY